MRNDFLEMKTNQLMDQLRADLNSFWFPVPPTQSPMPPPTNEDSGWCDCDPSPDRPSVEVPMGDICFFQCSKCGKEGFVG